MPDKQPTNEKGERHGYHEVYWDEKVYTHGNYINDEKYGYWFVRNNSYIGSFYIVK
jgi:hypothetical protein